MDVLARAVKIVLLLVLVVLALLVAFLAYLKFTDWSEHKDLVASAVERFSDWEVEQLGDIQVELFFPTEVIVDNVELTQTAPDSALASVSADHFEIRLDPLSPFLDERLVIHDIRASGARLVARQPTEEPEKEPGPLNLPHIGSARIRDTEILYQGTEGSRDLRASIESLDLSSQGEGEEVSVTGVGAVEGTDFDFNGTLGALDNLSGDDAPLPVSLRGSMAGDNFALQGTVALLNEGADFDLEFAAEGDSLPAITDVIGLPLSDVPPYQLQFAARKSAEEVVVENLEVSLGRSRLSGSAGLSLDETAPRLRADLDSSLLRQQDIATLIPEGKAEQSIPVQAVEDISPLALLEEWSADVELDVAEYQGVDLGPGISNLSLQARLEDATLDLEVDAEADDLALSLTGTAGPPQDGEVLPFQFELSGAEDRFSADGRVDLGGETAALEMSASAQGDSLERFAQLFGLPLARVPPYEAEFSVSASADAAALSDIKLTLGQSYLYGNASLRLEDPRPYLNADLGMSLLRKQDVLSLLPAEDEPQAEPNRYLIPRETLPLDVLQQLDGDFEIAIARYEGDPLGPVIEGMILEASLEDGRLSVDPLELLVAGGTLEGSLAVNGAEQPAALDADLAAESVALSDLVTAFVEVPEGEESIRGELAASLELSSSGNTPHELAAGADGNFSFVVYDGVMPAVIVEGLGFDITEAALSWFGETTVTEINCAVGSFAIESGVLDTEAFVISTEDSNIVGEGTINLEQETIDYELEAHAKDFSVLAVDAPIGIEGQLTDISIDLVSGELAAQLGAAALAALVNPLLAVAPLTELGTGETDRCSELRQQIQQVSEETQEQ